MAHDSVQLPPGLASVRDHSRQFRDFSFVYPVISRRSGGLSIGINLSPNKTCNFDCIYCEVDRRIAGKVSKLDLHQLRDELVSLVRLARSGLLGQLPIFSDAPQLTHEIRDIAFSGDGEPTLTSNFAECVQTVGSVIAAEKLKSKLVLITDASGLDKSEVKAGLRIMDRNNGELWAKLDAGTPEYFRKINRTHVAYDRIIRNIHSAALERPIIIQTLLLRVHDEPMSTGELSAYTERLLDITQAGGRIKQVHLYTIARPTAETFVKPLTAAELERFARKIRAATHLDVRTFA